MRQCDWLNTTGGPPVVAPDSVARGWGGVDESSVDRFASDFDAACQIADGIKLLTTRHGECLVLGGEPSQTAIVNCDLAGVLIVRWIYANAESDIIDAARALLLSNFGPDPVLLKKQADELIWIFDSACRLEDSSCLDRFEMRAETVKIYSADVEPDPQTQFIAHLFVPVGRGDKPSGRP